MSTDAKFEFRNFTPGPNLEHFANDGLAQIMRLAPYNTQVEAVIELCENAFRAIIKLDMGMTRAITNMSDPDIQKCLQKAFGKMRGDISRWRRDRALKANKKSQKEFEALQLEKKKKKFDD